MLDPQFRVLLDTAAAAGAVPLVRGSARESRDHYRALSLARRGAGFVPEAVAEVVDRTVDGPAGPIPVRIYTPEHDRGRAVTYLHGGGWVLGDLDTHDPVCRRVANAVGAVVVAVDYRLAPEHPHPVPLDDATAALAWTAGQYPERTLGVAGDSAGASMAAGVALRARDEGLPLAAQLLWYPATDPTMSSRSAAENGVGYFLSAKDMGWFYAQYVPGGSADPEIALAGADVTGVAPAVVATAEFDPLRDEGDAYAARLSAAGVTVRHVPGPGLIHGYAAFLGAVDAADVRGRGARGVRRTARLSSCVDIVALATISTHGRRQPLVVARRPVPDFSCFVPQSVQVRSSGRRSPHTQTQPLAVAGLPATNAWAGTSFVTTAPAAAKAYSPISVPQTTTVPAPRVAPRRTVVDSSTSGPRLIAERGRRSLVNSTLGPRNTSSSQVTPVNTSVPFLTVTLSPSTAPVSTKAQSQMLQSRPMRAPGSTCANAHTRVPGPTSSLSQRPWGWTLTPVSVPVTSPRRRAPTRRAPAAQG